MWRLALAALLPFALAGCEAGCVPNGGDVIWHQPGAFDAAVAIAEAGNVTVGRPGAPMLELPPGHPMAQRFGHPVVLTLAGWGEGEGGASVPLDGPPYFVHAGGDLGDLRRSVVELARHLAQDPSQVDAWAERHGVSSLTTLSDPTPLDIPLRIADAAAPAAGGKLHLQPSMVDVVHGKASWTVVPQSVHLTVGHHRVLVLGGDWVFASIEENPKDLADAEARGAEVARLSGLPDGPRDSVQVQEAMACG